jgi:hypothetical protein
MLETIDRLNALEAIGQTSKDTPLFRIMNKAVNE